jgi:hypothetical protein
MKFIIITSIFILMGFNKYENTSIIPASNKISERKVFSLLKAVLIIGPQDEDMISAIESMNKIAELFKTKGVRVQCFYDNDTDWEKIKIASKEANFFVYDGHGGRMGESGKFGGLCLKSMVTSTEIIEGLKLKKNAMIVFKSVCGGAGSSASDNGDIGIIEATKRVTDYSQPFFEIGASCYYANNLKDGCLLFLSEFFSGRTVKESFDKSTKTWTKIELSKEYQFDKGKQISIASADWGETVRTTYENGVKKVEKIPSTKDYDIAYVANPNFTIDNLMK